MNRGVTSPPRIGVVGAGVTGSRVVSHLLMLGNSTLSVTDSNRTKAQQLAGLYQSANRTLDVVDQSDLVQCKVVVLACGKPHVPLAKLLIEAGVNVVSLSDDLSDTVKLLDLHNLALARKTTLVVGAAASPGLSALLVHHARPHFDLIDEVHVALHGTGGPNCAHQHHDALAGQSIGWHDDNWIRRPAGSGRELCWFPEPVGAHDCYRAEMSDPVLLKHAMPELQRITARMSANRRDRFTSRLPMVVPPHAEGGMGGVRVEVRGWHQKTRITHVYGVSERIAQIAGCVAGSVAHQLAIVNTVEHGVVSLGSRTLPVADILMLVIRSGIRVHQFVGTK